MHGQLTSNATLGLAVYEARRRHGMTQRQLAEALGIHQRYISELETGHPKTLNAKLFGLLDQLGIKLSFEVLDETD